MKASYIQADKDLRNTEDLPRSVHTIVGAAASIQSDPRAGLKDKDGNFFVEPEYLNTRDMWSFNVAFPNDDERKSGKVQKKSGSKGARAYQNRKIAPDHLIVEYSSAVTQYMMYYSLCTYLTKIFYILLIT